MSMKYVDEYRDADLAKRISGEIAKLSADQSLKLMEVCGGHTHTIYKHGIEDVLPRTIDLVHGPGCPVCVLPMGRIDDAIAIARMDGMIFTTFGDMMRVPGSKGSLLDAKADGADVRFIYSPLDALNLPVSTLIARWCSLPSALKQLHPRQPSHSCGRGPKESRISQSSAIM